MPQRSASNGSRSRGRATIGPSPYFNREERLRACSWAVRTTETGLPAVNPQRMNPSNSRAALYLEALGFGGHTLSGALRALFTVA